MDSISNRQLTLLRKLRRKKYREKEWVFIVEGERAVEQVIENGAVETDHLFFDEKQELWLDPYWSKRASRLPSVLVDHGAFLEIADTDTPQGVLALCKMPGESDIQSLAQKKGILLATDAIQDPGNLGTIIRSACWFGIRGMLFGTGTADPFHPKVVRSTAGATGVLPYLTGDLSELLPKLETDNRKTFLLDSGPGSEPLADTHPPDKSILVVGNEGNGISEELFANHRKRIKIAGNPDVVESLNAAVACSIALYRFSKQ